MNQFDCPHNSLGVVDYCFICEFPLLHTWDLGLTFNIGGFSRRDAEWVLECVQKNSGKVVETGAGLSTLIFLSAGLEVTSYINDEDVVSRIKNEFSKFRDERQWKPNIGLSGDLLPIDNQHYSVALIDGGHGFPVPFVDFYFINRNLSAGSIVFIDDAQLYAPRELILNLVENINLFKLISISPSSKTYAFRKLTNQPHFPDFGGLVRDLRLKYPAENVNQELSLLRKDIESKIETSF